MDLRQLSAGSKSNIHEGAHARHDGTLHGRWLVDCTECMDCARAGGTCTVHRRDLRLCDPIADSMYEYHTHNLQLLAAHTGQCPCTCASWHLAGAYTTYFLTVDILVSLVFWAVGVLIFWRKSDTWIGLFVSLMLVMFAAAGISNTLNTAFQALYAEPAVTLLLVLLTYIQYSALADFPLTFPDGRFVPRWSCVVIAALDHSRRFLPITFALQCLVLAAASVRC